MAPHVHDWGEQGPHRFRRPESSISINDETLRDGLQNPSVTQPSLDDKRVMVRLFERLSIEHASFGMPGASERSYEDVLMLCRLVDVEGMQLRPNLGGRTLVQDVEPIARIRQEVAAPLEACLFLGSSPLRCIAEDWNLDQMMRNVHDSVSLAAREGMPVTFITEDTVRSAPDVLERLFGAAVDAGASRLCLCDTVGAAMPHGVRNLVSWTRDWLNAHAPHVTIDWHGHRDRGLGLANTLAAMEAGATRLHGTVLGIGERVGNAPTEQLLVNLRLLGLRDASLDAITELVDLVSRALGVPVPASQPIVGRDAFRTATGVHAAAVRKALEKGDPWLADAVYSGVPAHWIGREQEIEIGPLSGTSNVVHFLRAHGFEERPEWVESILRAAKRGHRVLDVSEVLACIASQESTP